MIMIRSIVGNWLIPAAVLIVALLAAFFFGPAWAGMVVVTMFCFALAMAISSVLQEQTKSYREKRIGRTKLALNVLGEIMVMLLAMTLAALLGRYIAEIATEQISNGLAKFIAGMVIGLLAGMGVGFLVKRTWGRLAG
jgi:hypothetical protein